MTWRHQLIGLIAALLGVDLRETFHEVETVTDWKDPVEELHDLPDEDGRVYCWKVSSNEAGQQLSAILEEEFVKKLGREPRATHIILTDEEQLRELSPDELRAHVKPFDGGGR